VLAGIAIFIFGTLFGSAGIVFGGLLALAVLPGGLGSGIAALVKANRRPDLYAGKGLAIAGLATSGVGLLFLPLIAAIAIPNFLAARRAANEGSAVRVMQVVASAQQTYIESVGNGYCGDIEALAGLTLVDISLAKGELNGYRFYVSNLPGGGCEIHGVPKSSSDGNWSFYYSTTEGQIRGAERNGAPAGSGDPPLGSQTTVRNGRSRNSL
jgi:hypothetical protein